MNRINFFGSVSGVEYPEMIVNFFDHFVALKQLVEDSGTVKVLESTEKSITFSIEFNDNSYRDNALAAIYSLGGVIVIYERPISISVSTHYDNSIKISLT